MSIKQKDYLIAKTVEGAMRIAKDKKPLQIDGFYLAEINVTKVRDTLWLAEWIYDQLPVVV